MPIYGYTCENCNYTFEVFQPLSAPPQKKCPECQGPLRKLFYPTSVIYKCGGFYHTEYGKGKAAKEENKSESKETAKDKDTAREDNGQKSDWD